MKTLNQILDESDFANPKSPGDKAFVDKHIIQKTDYPHPPKGGSNDDVFSGKKQKKKKRIADPEEGQDPGDQGPGRDPEGDPEGGQDPSDQGPGAALEMPLPQNLAQNWPPVLL